MTDHFHGLDDFRAALRKRGWTIGAMSSYLRDTGCDWMAHRPTKFSARECGHNTGRHKQLEVVPYLRKSHVGDWESCEVVCTGETAGVWYQLRAYALKPSDFLRREAEIESAVIRAWNALEVPK